MSKLLPFVGVLTLLMGLAWQVNAAELSLVCPCQAERVGQTAVKITAGVINTGATESGELRVFLGSSSGLPIFSYRIQAFRYFPETLKPGLQYSAGTEATVAFRLPSANALDSLGQTNLVLGLEEKVNGEWLTRDKVRLGEPVNFPDPETGGESANYKLFFEGKPTLEIAGDQATLRIPKVVNSSLEAVTISRVVVGNYSSAEFWGQTFRYGLNKENLSIIVAAQSSLTNIEIKGDYMGPVTNYPFTHLSLRNEQGGVEVWESIEAREGNVISTHPFTANSFDFLVDSDDDDVSDVNENLFNTDPNDFLSQPGTLVIDVMALYTPAVAAKYNDEPVTRILHELEWGNQAFRNSNINARFRLVKAQSTNYEGLDSRVAISAVADQSGVFEGVDAVRQDAGADLLVLYIEDDPSDDSCGIGDLAGVDLNGDMAFTRRSQIVSVVAAGCRSSTLTHEFGHNLGLGHDAREESNKGAFGWSRGHGINGSFVTTMAYQSGYRYFGPDIQYFSNPDISCQGQPCGVDRSDLSLGADAALSIRTTMYQIAELTPQVKERDLDGDGFLDQADNCPLVSSVNQLDTDGDGKGNACDDDDDGDGVLDKADAFPLDSTETLDSDGDGVGDNGDAFPQDASEWADADSNGVGDNQDNGSYLGRAYHMTASTRPNLSEAHIINTSDAALSFTGTLFHKSGSQLGASNVALHEGLIEPQGRLVLLSTDLEQRFNELPWTGPAMLDVRSTNQFEVMIKLSRSGRVTNTNCVRTSSAQNVEGTDGLDVSYVRFINDGVTALANIRGTLYDTNGNPVGQQDVQFFDSLGPREAVFLGRDSISNIVGDTWTGAASLVLSDAYENLKLMNLNFVNDETFFNFSCYESGK
jgi:hypothetical protein